MNIKVIGWLCPRTEQTLMNAQAALREICRREKVEWISDVHKIVVLGIHRRPALIINGKLKSEGRVPSVHEITTWMEKELMEEFIS
jgi:hypothetical protein